MGQGRCTVSSLVWGLLAVYAAAACSLACQYGPGLPQLQCHRSYAGGSGSCRLGDCRCGSGGAGGFQWAGSYSTGRAQYDAQSRAEGSQAKQEGTAKWKQYEASLKAAFAKERSRYAKDQERMAKEIVEAETAQEDARLALRQAFLCEQGHVPDVPMTDLPPVDQVFASWEQEEQSDYGAVLQRAMDAQGLAAVTPPRAARTVPRTPAPGLVPVSSVQLGGMALGTSPALAAADPYLQTGYLGGIIPPGFGPQPTAVPDGLGPPVASTSAAVLPPPANVPAGTATPMGTGTAGMAPDGTPCPKTGLAGHADGSGQYGPSPTLGDKLRRRRALEPFGGGQDVSAKHSDPAPETGPAGTRRVNIVQDDDEEEYSPGHAEGDLS